VQRPLAAEDVVHELEGATGIELREETGGGTATRLQAAYSGSRDESRLTAFVFLDAQGADAMLDGQRPSGLQDLVVRRDNVVVVLSGGRPSPGLEDRIRAALAAVG
jgi:hypothetical protein